MKKIEIKHYTHYHEQEILDLYNSLGWIRYTEKPEMLKRAFEGSLVVMGAFESENLIGITHLSKTVCRNIFIEGGTRTI